MFKKLHLEILLGIVFVLGGTFVVYNFLADYDSFWSAQNLWSVGLIACWFVVAFGYLHQGWKIHEAKKSSQISLLLPCMVFLVQCILFVKGIYYNDSALIIGAMLVNSGVVFNIIQIYKYR